MRFRAPISRSIRDFNLLMMIPLVCAACSGPSALSVQPAEMETPPASPFTTGTYILAENGDLKIVSLDADQSDSIGTGNRLVSASLDPSTEVAVIAAADADRTRLYLVNRRTKSSVELHEGPSDLVYSVAWSPDGQEVAFGYYQPSTANDRPAQGAGDIEIARVEDGSTSRLGCSASKEVILWSNPDQLVVRATDNLYRVARADCATIQTVDVRRWHQITPSPTRSRLAYIYRELAFNRATREYEPDSALFVVGTPGADGFKVAGDRYRPRNMAWSPDGSELAFDVLIDPEGEQRAVAVYNVERVETTFVSRPAEGEPSQTHPTWDPTGSRISFLSDGNQLVVKSLDTVFGKAISVGGNSATRLVGWFSPTTVIVADAATSLWMYDLASDQSEQIGSGTAFVF